MAIFKSQLVTQASGSVGGLTFTRTRSGMTMRGRSMPVNPDTPAQQVIRGAQSFASNAWMNTLTDLQREGWSNYAAEISRKNKLGDSIRLTGIAMFVRCNVPRIQAGIAVAADAPSDFTLGNPPKDVNAVISEGSPNGFTVDWTAIGLEATDQMLIYVSRPMSPTRIFFKGPFRFNSKFNASTGVGNIVEANLPQPIAAGNKVVVRARISYTDGRLSDAVTVSMIAAAPIPGEEEP